MTDNQISIIVLAGNEQAMIGDCLKSCLWADKIILVAANSTDNTIDIAKTIVPSKLTIIRTFDEYNKNFSKWRNLGFQSTTTKWLLYVDADERVTPDLALEIKKLLKFHNTDTNYYVIPRENYYLGLRVKYGGSYPDYVKRLFLKPHFSGFTGILHEEPIVTGSFGYLNFPLRHFTHRDLSSMLTKTMAWTDVEATKIYQQGHPPVVWWRFFRMILTKFWQRFFCQQMWRDGVVGWISVIFEVFDTFIIYARLWELQNSSLSKSK
ncbi:MAG: glycosyltransferase family 2 protein [Candidatus Shapirobacteria bacterium]|jgi:glycosyltransferase involved in cell wall biosynthesis